MKSDDNTQNTDFDIEDSPNKEVEEESPDRKQELSPGKVKEEDGSPSKAKEKSQTNLIVDEEKLHDKVYWSDYYDYMQFAFGMFGVFIYSLLAGICAVVLLFLSYYLTNWTSLPFEEQQKSYHPWIFGGTIVVYNLLTFTRG